MEGSTTHLSHTWSKQTYPWGLIWLMVGHKVYICLPWHSGYSDTFAWSRGCHCTQGYLYRWYQNGLSVLGQIQGIIGHQAKLGLRPFIWSLLWGLMRMNKALSSSYSYYELNPSLAVAVVTVLIKEDWIWLKYYFVPAMNFAWVWCDWIGY